MSSDSDQQSIRVVVAPDDLTAELVLPQEYSPQMLTQPTCLNLVRAAGVEVVQEVIDAVEALVADPPPPDQPHRVVIARATDPQDGVDGYIDWSQGESSRDESLEETDISHYERSAFGVVQIGQVIGKIVQAATGVDGRDVRGGTLAAKIGKPVRVETDETILTDASGQLVAQAQGIVDRNSTKLRIRQVLEIDGYVDFSTGNIDFPGHVIVNRGVRDCFVIKATGGVEVRGLIEAATIDCGEDFIASGGMAGRERGQVTVAGNLKAKYLDNVCGTVVGDLEFDREIINCELLVHGAVRSINGRITTSCMTISKILEVGVLGSHVEAQTTLILGGLSKIAPIQARLIDIEEQLSAKRDGLMREQDQINDNAQDLCAANRERQTEIMFELHNIHTRLAQSASVKDELTNHLHEVCDIDLVVHRSLHAGVCLVAGVKTFKIREDIRGPVRISLGGKGSIIYRLGKDDPKDLSQISDVSVAA